MDKTVVFNIYIERAGLTTKNQTIAIGATVINDKSEQLLLGFIPGRTSFSIIYLEGP